MGNHTSQTAETIIHDLSTDGRGVARVDERVYFVERVLPGDRVRLALDANAKPPTATVLALLKPSPGRVPHPCPHAAECRGSLWGGLNYAQQLRVKQGLIERTLRKTVGDVTVLPVASSPLLWGYRNRLSLSVWTDHDHACLGFQTGARETIGLGVHTCKLGAPEVDAALSALSARWAKMEFRALPPLPVRLQLHATACGAGVLLVFSDRISSRDRQAWDQLFSTLPLPGGAWYAQGSHAGIIDFREPIIAGESAAPMLTQALGRALPLHPAAFSQANPAAAALVEQRLRRLSQEIPFAVVWDLYGGFGALGMAVARPEQPVHVFEDFALCRSSDGRTCGRLGTFTDTIPPRRPTQHPAPRGRVHWRAGSGYSRPAPQRHTSSSAGRDPCLPGPPHRLPLLQPGTAR